MLTSGKVNKTTKSRHFFSTKNPFRMPETKGKNIVKNVDNFCRQPTNYPQITKTYPHTICGQDKIIDFLLCCNAI